MRLSIIVPVLNEAAVLPGTLDRLRGLRAAGHEVIVADGGSTDGSAALAQSWADRVIEAPVGRARQMNAGAAVASGSVLLFLHADTHLPKEAGREVFAGLGTGRHDWGRFDIRLSGRRPMLRMVEFMMNLRSRLTGIATGDQAIFVRRALFERIGGFPDIPLMEDIALSRALKRHGPPLCLKIRAVTSSRRWERHGLLRTILLMWWLRLLHALGVPAEKLARHYR
ncbi:MAG: TIGR04283 family arsenosugar biosynthesis glycosyltransferase [Pseudomonadota bacterium]